jgi:sugar lactone lactonase YvrE
MVARPSIRPVVWTPPPMPERGRARIGTRPLPPLTVIEVPGTGPEDVLIDSDGWIITGLNDGRLLRIKPDGRRMDVIADTRGRPLGIELFPDGRLLVCDAKRGLLRVDPKDGKVESLVSRVGGERLLFCNNAAIASDGSVYFSDSSRRFGIDEYKADIVEHSRTGRLLHWFPDGRVDVLLDGLAFANGVALARDESFVIVAETGAYRLQRRWLTGPRAGTSEVFVDNLSGFPDNISTGSDGLIWIALVSPRNPVLDFLHARRPELRQLVWALPDSMQPAPIRTVWVLAVDEAGRIVHDLQGESERFHMVTGVRESGGRVYLGSLEERAIALFDLSKS